MAPIGWLMAAPAAHGAAYAPGVEADPPTGEAPPVAASPAEPLRGSGINWVFGPWRTTGTLALDLRWLRFDGGGNARQTAVLADVETASYLWQPWFAQVRLGVGLVASTDSNGHGDEPRVATTGNNLTGQAQLALFPVSRFPFTARFEATDGRTSTDGFDTDLRTRRLTLLQSYRPESGNDHYQLQVDASRLLADGQSDTLLTVEGDALWQRGPHRFELGVSGSDNRSFGDRERTRLTWATARHGWHPDESLGVDSLASWFRSRTRFRDEAFELDLGSEVNQLSSLVTWRPREGDLPLAVLPNTLVVGSARWVGARTLGGTDGATLQSINATLGASADLSPSWRVSGAAAVNQFDVDRSEPARSASLNVGANWSPRSLPLGPWRYVPTLALDAGTTRSNRENSDRDFASAQFSHSVTRDLLESDDERLTFSVAQSVGALAVRAQQERHLTTTATHSLGLVWQTVSPGGHQRFASASLSDYRTHNGSDGDVQLVNLQWSERSQLTRMSSWSGSVTLQGTRAHLRQSDEFGGAGIAIDDGWQRFASGTLSYEHQRAFDVPRLRFSLLAGISSQQFARRTEGDIDAPLHFVSRSIEARLDYTIGKLDARLSARAARVDERNVAAIVARVQRRF
jgi:hypothetical protein